MMEVFDIAADEITPAADAGIPHNNTFFENIVGNKIKCKLCYGIWSKSTLSRKYSITFQMPRIAAEMHSLSSKHTKRKLESGPWRRRKFQ
jgi:hypothetical protein